MQVILTGATGLVGSSVLHHVLNSTSYGTSIGRVSILSRKIDIPLLAHPQRPRENTQTVIDVIEHHDFTSYPDSLLSKLKDSKDPAMTSQSSSSQIAVIWAQGVSQNQVDSAEQYTEITKQYPLNAARAFATAFHPTLVNFVYVSGEGATSKPGFFTPLFGRVKGETEQELLALARQPEYANLRVYNVRPAGVDPGARQGGQPAVNDIWEVRLREMRGIGGVTQRALVTTLMPVLRAGALKKMHTPTDELGRVLLGLGTGSGKPMVGEGVEDGGWTLRNSGLRTMAKEMVAAQPSKGLP